MKLIQTPEKIQVVNKGKILSQVLISEHGGDLQVHSLTSECPQALLRVVRAVKELAKTKRIYIALELENKHYARLLKLYMRAGFTPAYLFMVGEPQ